MRYGLGGLEALSRRAAEAGQLAPNDPALVTRLVMAALIAACGEIVEGGAERRVAAAHEAVRRLLGSFRRNRSPGSPWQMRNRWARQPA